MNEPLPPEPVVETGLIAALRNPPHPNAPKNPNNPIWWPARTGPLPTPEEITAFVAAYFEQQAVSDREFIEFAKQCIRSEMREVFNEAYRPYREAKERAQAEAEARWRDSPAALEARCELERHTNDPALLEELMQAAARNGTIEWPGGHYNTGRASATVAWRWHVAWESGEVQAEVEKYGADPGKHD